MTTRILAVSPHLDDAVLSAGATLAQAALDGADVHILTLFTTVPAGPLSRAATAFHLNCGLPLDHIAGQIRRAEDRAATRNLGATPHHAGLPDAIYRRRPDGQWLCVHERGMFDNDLPHEPEVHEAVLAYTAEHIRRLQPATVVTCAAIGSHIDHRITRSACMTAAADAGATVALWEDLPYAIGTELPPETPIPEHTLSTAAWKRKWSAVASYGSQTKMLWPDGRWRHHLDDHAQARGSGSRCELVWRPDPLAFPVRSA